MAVSKNLDTTTHTTTPMHMAENMEEYGDRLEKVFQNKPWYHFQEHFGSIQAMKLIGRTIEDLCDVSTDLYYAYDAEVKDGFSFTLEAHRRHYGYDSVNPEVLLVRRFQLKKMEREGLEAHGPPYWIVTLGADFPARCCIVEDAVANVVSAFIRKLITVITEDNWKFQDDWH